MNEEMRKMSEQHVTDTELESLARDLRADDAQGYTFHRLQDGYADGILRAVFVHQHEEPIGSPLGRHPVALLSLLGRLAADLKAERETRGALDTAIAEAGIEAHGPEDTLLARVARLIADANRAEERFQADLTARDKAWARLLDAEINRGPKSYERAAEALRDLGVDVDTLLEEAGAR